MAVQVPKDCFKQRRGDTHHLVLDNHAVSHANFCFLNGMSLHKTDLEPVDRCGAVTTDFHPDRIQLKNFGRWNKNMSHLGVGAHFTVDPRLCYR